MLAPGYDPATKDLTVALLRWMLASTVIFVVSGLLMGVLNANDQVIARLACPLQIIQVADMKYIKNTRYKHALHRLPPCQGDRPMTARLSVR